MQKKKQEEKKISLREFGSLVAWVFGLFYSIAPVALVVNLIFNALEQLRGLVYAFIFAKIIDSLIELIQMSDGKFEDIIPYLAILFAYRLANDVITDVRSYTESVLREKGHYLLKRVLYQQVLYLGIETIEQPAIANRLQRVHDYVYSFPNFLQKNIRFIAKGVALIAATATLATFFPILIPILIVLSIPQMFIDKYYLQKNWQAYLHASERRRKNDENFYHMVDTANLKEILLTKAHVLLDRKYLKFTNWWLAKVMGIYKRWYGLGLFTNIYSLVVLFISYGVIFKRLIDGLITVGAVTFQIRAIDIFYESFSWTVFEIFNLRQDAIRFKDGKKIFDMKPVHDDGTITLETFKSPPSIKFQNVSFKYPRTKKYVIQDLTLNVKKGEKIAIVGVNGAGKTTLVKLLSRFYRVQKGSIFINDYDIDELKLEDWYKNVSILYQEFNKYSHLTAKENITIGEPMQKHQNSKVKKAAEYADALDFIMEYDDTFDQILSERFSDGIRPSSGQWQKLALARFFYRDASVVIFDEPTAAIDAESEYNIFNKIYRFFKNKTVIIISHRFSTVRNADRIIVLDKGKIIEEGTHKELLAIEGKYAKAFKLQAEGYKA